MSDAHTLGVFPNLDLLRGLTVPLRICFGKVTLRLEDVLKLKPGSLVEVQQADDQLADIIVNGRVIARGEVVIVEDNFAVRVESIVEPSDRMDSLG
jgi:flagellar motor switch protein FliN/FliY